MPQEDWVGRETGRRLIRSGAWNARRSVLQGGHVQSKAGQAVESLMRQTWEHVERRSIHPSARTTGGSSEASGAPRIWEDTEQLRHKPPQEPLTCLTLQEHTSNITLKSLVTIIKSNIQLFRHFRKSGDTQGSHRYLFPFILNNFSRSQQWTPPHFPSPSASFKLTTFFFDWTAKMQIRKITTWACQPI